MAKKTDFFLGANSADGFYSLYDQLGDTESTYDFMILKGGPGVGKSTFMKRIGAAAEERGLETEQIRCSGDPASLDAVLIPSLGVAVVDGTAPHVMEPKYPAAVDRYLNLGCFYDVDRLKERRQEIIACTRGYQAEYEKAYACLRACGAVRSELESGMAAWVDLEKLRRRLRNIWLRQRGKRRRETGTEKRRFLGGLTPAGRVWCVGSLNMLCSHVYELRDPYHLTAPLLTELCGMIRADGYDVLLCMDPDVPGRIQHLMVPELGVGFVTTDRRFALQERPHRRLRVDQMLDREQFALMRGALRLKERLADELEAEGAEHLRLAGEKHRELEMIYHPFVDFDGVAALAEMECRRIFR